MLLRIPPEIRCEIYNILFRSDRVDGTISPDPHHTRHLLGSTGKATLSQSLGLLRTCTQVYEEAVEILYGNQTFKFDEQDHTMRPVEEYVRIIEVWSTEMEDWSTEIVSSTDPQRVCDFNSMETFFRLIGQNMHRIRHIELEFRIISSFTHCTFLFRIGNPLYNQPEVLYDALEFLADSNSVGRGLKTLEIKHPDTTNSGPPPAGQHQSGATNHANPQATFELFMSHPDPMHSLLGDSLRRLKGVKLICKEVEAWKDEGHEFCMACYQARGLLAIKADMMR